MIPLPTKIRRDFYLSSLQIPDISFESNALSWSAELKDLIGVSGICFVCIMVEVPLTRGKVALVDDGDAERVLVLRWQYRLNRTRSGIKEYAYHGSKSKTGRFYLHRFILNLPDGVMADHKDGNGLNCQRYNLRIATRSQNQYNKRLQSNNVLGFKGVRASGSRPNPYRATIFSDGKHEDLGYFKNPQDAARAYDERARELFGEFACLNFPEPHEQPARVPKGDSSESTT